MTRREIRTGIDVKDSRHLPQLLLEKDSEARSIMRRASSFNPPRIDHSFQGHHESHPRLILSYGDLAAITNLIRIIQQVRQDEIYHLGAQSHAIVGEQHGLNSNKA